MTSDQRVDDYLARLPPWQQDLCTELRRVIRKADPQIEETIKRTVQPYFVLDGNVCALLATKDHVNLFLYDGAMVPDPAGIITGGHDNQTARTIAFYEGDLVPVKRSPRRGQPLSNLCGRGSGSRGSSGAPR
jgi:hypothetical protein